VKVHSEADHQVKTSRTYRQQQVAAPAQGSIPMKHVSSGVSSRRRLHPLMLYISSFCVALMLCCSLWSCLRPPAVLTTPLFGSSTEAVAAEALHVAHVGSAAWGYSYARAIQTVYHSKGYTLCALSMESCWLQLARTVDCAAMFNDYIETLQKHIPLYPTPKELPSHLRDEFLLQNLTLLSSFYTPQPDYAPDAAAPVWTQDTIKGFMQQTAARMPVGHYGKASMPLYQALTCHPVAGLEGAVFGSEIPWLEGLLIASGGSFVAVHDWLGRLFVELGTRHAGMSGPTRRLTVCSKVNPCRL
jgi:hypothetical protein